MEEKERSPIFYTRLIGEITFDSIKEVLKDIDRANSLESVKKVVLAVNSPGGLFYPSFGLYDHVKGSPKHIDIIAEGYCASTAVMILQAGRKRISRPHTLFMVHPSWKREEERKPYDEFFTIADQYRKDHDLFIRLSIERSGISRKEFEKMYQPRKYLTAQEALHFGPHGLIDAIKES